MDHFEAANENPMVKKLSYSKFRQALLSGLRELRQRFSKQSIDLMVSSCKVDEEGLIKYKPACKMITRHIIDRRSKK